MGVGMRNEGACGITSGLMAFRSVHFLHRMLVSFHICQAEPRETRMRVRTCPIWTCYFVQE